jgi:hypothetical protein
MPEVSFGEIVSAIQAPAHTVKDARRLQIAAEPKPFVAPTFSSLDDRPLQREIIFMEASAAVGKSTVAKYLSATRKAPLLDLSATAVSTGTLKALLLDMEGSNPIEAFHAGKLPIIIDALDEGRLKSAETGFENFLITIAELLSEDRSVTDRVKIIFFGRQESTALAKNWLEVGGISEPDIGLIDIGFFDEAGARALINAVATSAGDVSPESHGGTVADLVSAYFASIESALGLPLGELWQTERGRAFAGYAPELAAIGALLSEITNYIVAANRLRESGTEEAWSVIEKVLYEILYREREKLTEKLALQTSGPLPKEAYDPLEQLTLLTQYLHHQSLTGSSRVSLLPADMAKYREMINQYVPEHPFIAKKQFGNAVLASVVMAHAIHDDLLQDTDLNEIANISRQPFLWRSLSQRLTDQSLIDGRYVGHILNSYWSDPLSPGETIYVRTQFETGSTGVFLPRNGRDPLIFSAVPPISYYGELRNIDSDILGDMRCEAHNVSAPDGTFYFKGENIVICDKAIIAVNNVRVSDLTVDGQKQAGALWFEASLIESPAQLHLYINGSRVGWGGIVARRYPWSRYPSVLKPPYQALPAGSILEALLQESSRRLSSGVTVTVKTDYSAAEDDPQMRWVNRQFRSQFPEMVRLMIAHGLATSARLPTSGDGRVRIRFNVGWGDLIKAVHDPNRDFKLKPFVLEAMQKVN